MQTSRNPGTSRQIRHNTKRNKRRIRSKRPTNHSRILHRQSRTSQRKPHSTPTMAKIQVFRPRNVRQNTRIHNTVNVTIIRLTIANIEAYGFKLRSTNYLYIYRCLDPRPGGFSIKFAENHLLIARGSIGGVLKTIWSTATATTIQYADPEYYTKIHKTIFDMERITTK